MVMFSVFFPHTMGRCLGVAADTTNTEYISMNSCITRGPPMSVVAFLALRLLGLVVCWQVICVYV